MATEREPLDIETLMKRVQQQTTALQLAIWLPSEADTFLSEEVYDSGMANEVEKQDVGSLVDRDPLELWKGVCHAT